MKDKKKILFIYTTFSTFVKTDFEILSQKYDVVKYQFIPVKGIGKTIVQFTKQFFFLLFNNWRFDAFFIWFADNHSFLPVLFAKVLRRKSFLVVGGYDVVKMPELNYGVFISKIRGYFAIFSMKHSTLNLAVSKNVERKVRWIAKKSNTRLLYNSVNIPAQNNRQVKKEDLVITVGLITSERTFFLKGIDTFVKVAEMLPEFRFKVIGMSKDLPYTVLNNRPQNVEWVDRVSHHELEVYYKKAKVYCQFSRSESFGVAIVEAMNFGCIPVVTNVGGMPEIVKSYGVVSSRNVSEISGAISDIVKNRPQLLSGFDKELAVRSFLLSERKKKLFGIMNQLL